MKSFYLILAALFISQSPVKALSVSDVRVSVTSDSAAVAREQAIEKAHALAFEKLVKENFPDQAVSLPSPDKLMNMVTNFSIDKEKTSPKKYAASMTFQFDGGQVQSWLKRTGTPSGPSLATEPTPQTEAYRQEQPEPYREETTAQSFPPTPYTSHQPVKTFSGPIIVTVSYNSLPEWQHIKKTLEQSQGMIDVSVTNLSAQQASIELQYGGNIQRLQQHLVSQGINLASQGNSWIITSNRTLR